MGQYEDNHLNAEAGIQETTPVSSQNKYSFSLLKGAFNPANSMFGNGTANIHNPQMQA